MPIKVCGSLSNADNFVILHKSHKVFENRYYSNSSCKGFTDDFKDVTIFQFNSCGISYFEEQNLPDSYTIMFIPYFDYIQIDDKERTIRNVYAEYAHDEIEIEHPVELLKEVLRYGLANIANSYYTINNN